MDEAFLKRLIETFKVEAEEILQTISSGLIGLEKNIDPGESKIHIDNIYMAVHSLKGAARSVNFIEVETLCQSIESIFEKIKSNKQEISKNLFDLLHSATDLISQLINTGEDDRFLIEIDEILAKINAETESPSVDKQFIASHPVETDSRGVSHTPVPLHTHLPEPVQEIIQEKQQPAPEIKRKKTNNTEIVRIPAVKLDSLLLQSEEMLSSKLIIKQNADELRNMVNFFGQWKKEYNKILPGIEELKFRSGKINSHDLNSNEGKLGSITDFIFWNHEQLKLIDSQLKSFVNQFDLQKRQIGGMVDNLLEDVKNVLMLPFSTIMEIFPKMVRQISADQGKDIELIIDGSEIEIDKRILEEIKDPLTHILRNSIDHGMEKPEERVANNKPAKGIINVKISQFDNNKVEILVTDNGRGINSARVKNIAVKNGLLTDTEAKKLSENELISLIFQPGFSTAPIVTDLSGRGLGLAIVKEKIEKQGGTVSITTGEGNYTSFKIILPVRIATFKGVLVQVGGQIFVVPGSNLERVLRPRRDSIKIIENRETILFREKNISLVYLADILEMTRENNPEQSSEFIHVLIITPLKGSLVPGSELNFQEKSIAFAVDAILDEQEILVKQFNKQLSRVRNISGATILGTGKVVPILNTLDLVKSAVKNDAAPNRNKAEVVNKTEKKYILVAEDSITSRMLIKNILEAGGYKVKTVINGLEAFNALKEENFDLLVSDIEMPVMNGFDLISRIRSDKQTENLPAILITSLSSQEDRERGIDVGANAYIVKSNFDQSNLLGIIKKII
jgi:two-component system chemotaxis sensor kinase CheA